ncbi:MAG: diacylglycerol/lipid kinase family protein [Sedimentisphaeraceae bacterium JB056]
MILVMCPKARSGKGKKLWSSWLKIFDSANAEYKTVETEYSGHAFEIAREADDTVVAAGGDGTINEVINGVMKSSREKEMGILYCGTSPDFCRFHKIPIQPKQAAEALLKKKERLIDVAEIEYTKNGLKENAFFGCSCNIGMGAMVAEFANKYRKFLGDTCGTLWGVLLAVMKNKMVDVELTIDNEKKKLPRCNHIVILKNPFIASGLKLNVDIKPDDGLGVVIAINDKNKLQLLSMLPGFYNGNIINDKTVLVRKFKSIDVKPVNGMMDVEFDGDPKGMLPVRVEIVSNAMKLIGVEDA